MDKDSFSPVLDRSTEDSRTHADSEDLAFGMPRSSGSAGACREFGQVTTHHPKPSFPPHFARRVECANTPGSC